MKIAVTYEDGKVFQHFGHTGFFKIYEAEDGEIKNCEIVGTDGFGHGALAGFLSVRGVSVLICGGIGGGAQAALAEQGIKVYGGVQGDADEAVANFLAETLEYNPDVKCDHHDHGDHSCGDRHDHGCGGEGCKHGKC